MKFKLFIFCLFPLVGLGQKSLSITNNAYTTEINSPGRGAQYWNGTPWDGSQAPLIGGSSTGYTGYVRLEWDDVELAQGLYKLTGGYPSLEFWIRLYIERGESFAFGGVMTVCDGCGNISYDGGESLYPQYLHNLMQAESVKDWKTSGGIWIPNWNSPSYLARFQALNDTIAKFIQNGSYTPSGGRNAGKLVRYRDVLDWVDIRGYGNFGEFHNYPYDGEMPSATKPTVQSLKNIINVTVNSFPNTQLILLSGLFNSTGSSSNPPEVAYYALNLSNNYGKFGWRRDNIGGPGDDAYLLNNPNTYNGTRLDTAIVNRWKYAMITGEPLNGGGTCCPLYYDIRREIGVYHYAGFGNGNYGGNSQAVWDTVTNAFKLTGYRYQLSGIIDSVFYNNANFSITLNWNNIGAAPMYQKRWKIRYRLVNSGGTTVQTFTSTKNLYLMMSNNAPETFILNNVALGNYTLRLIVEDTTGYFNPLPLNINTRNTDGSYTIASVRVGTPSALPIPDGPISDDDNLFPSNYRAAIKVFPNPASTELNVLLARYTAKPVVAHLYDVTGRWLMGQQSYAENFKVNISQLDEGVYIFRLFNRYNIEQRTEKIVKWK